MPVLSEQITVTDPRVSTLGNRRTSALRAAILCTPIASTSVTTAGNPSGTAATARLTARSNTSNTSPPRHRSNRKMTPTITRHTPMRSRPSSASRRCNGVISGSDRSKRIAIRPSSVVIPVDTTIATPRPAATTVPACTIDRRSPSGVSTARIAPASFTTGNDSPVSADSCTCMAYASMSLASAGTLSPASNSIRSPTTSFSAGKDCFSPFRTTLAIGAESRCNAAKALIARSSCRKPMIVLTSTIATMTAASAHSPMKPEITMAPSRIQITSS